jgi:glycosyltransferase involved in cell wall biosynthesis
MTAASSSPGVSVVIPAYNYARYLPIAIDSVLKQDYPHYEIIVVDDGSTDNTAEVVAGYGNKVRYIHQKNAGLPAARNTGIKAAGFDFVGFLDADDQWLPEMLGTAMGKFGELPKERWSGWKSSENKTASAIIPRNLVPRHHSEYTFYAVFGRGSARGVRHVRFL